MLFEINLICNRCNKKFSGVRAMSKNPFCSFELLCPECMDKITNNEKAKWLEEKRSGKSIEQRIAWLEEWIYDHKEIIEALNLDDVGL